MNKREIPVLIVGGFALAIMGASAYAMYSMEDKPPAKAMAHQWAKEMGYDEVFGISCDGRRCDIRVPGGPMRLECSGEGCSIAGYD